MASAASNESPSPSMVSNAPAGATGDEAKALAGNKCRCECQPPPKDLQNKEEEDARTGLVAIEKIVHPLLLAAASNGKWEQLNFLLNREDAHAQPQESSMLEHLAPQGASNDLEEGCGHLDNVDGLFPIHVAASLDWITWIVRFVDKYPRCAGLRDKKGRTFLHVAVGKGCPNVVKYACENKSLAWILNVQDHEGNTALHLAVQAEHLLIFFYLYRNSRVQLSLTNAQGLTPLDIAKIKVPLGLMYFQNPEVQIYQALRLFGGTFGACRLNHHLGRNYERIHQEPKPGYDKENIKDTTQSLCIGSVLIATVAFGAAFALPGGYRQDGTPTLAGRYTFHAFVMANTFAFVFSAMATVCLMYSGSPTFNTWIRKWRSTFAYVFMEISVTCLVAAFALAGYLVLGSVAHKTAIAICVISPLVVLSNHAENMWNLTHLASSVCTRNGFQWSLLLHTVGIAGYTPFLTLGPILFIFVWAAYGRDHPVSPAPAPAR